MTTRPDPSSSLPDMASGPPAAAGYDDDPDQTIPGKLTGMVSENSDHSSQDTPTGAPLLDQDPSSPDAWPTTGYVGRYALKYCVGEGGLGTVYAAHDPLLARWLAIKTLHVSLPEADRQQFNAIFLNEAQAAGGLSHPHIVTVFDVGAGDGDTYIAMELLRGKDLRHSLAGGWRPSIPDAALIMRRVADALSYAHHKGVIHRDIKPANIFMVSRTHPKVLDFGIARIRQVEATANDGVSRFGDLVGGSPYYMSPEQIRHESVDRRADVYAMGVVLYELLTGRKPFTGTDLDAILAAVLTQPLIPPHELDPRVPQALSDVVMRAMARDPSARTRSARLFSQELRVWLDGQALGGAGDDKASRTAPASASSRSGATNRAGARKLAETSDHSTSSWAPYARYAAWLMGTCVLTVAAWLGWREYAARPALVAVQSPSTGAGVSAPPASVTLKPVTEVAAVSVVQNAPPPSSLPVASSLAAGESVVVAPVNVPAPARVEATNVLAKPLEAAPKPVAKPMPPVEVKPTGTLFLAISPWGRVSVNGRSVGVAPPLTQLTLPAGKHTVTVVNDESPAFTQTVQVDAGQGVTVSHAF